jgi:hypothetical protein
MSASRQWQQRGPAEINRGFKGLLHELAAFPQAFRGLSVRSSNNVLLFNG